MIKYAKLECTESEYNYLQQVQRSNNSKVKEQFVGSRRKLFNYDTMIATISLSNSLQLGKLPKQKFYAFLGAFNKQLYKQFRINDNLHNLHIDFEGASREKNYEAWENLKEGEFFYNIDLKSAYWQVANKIGYLKDKMFNTYFALDDYKMAKRLCISFLARQNYMVYYVDGDEYKITCNTSVFKKVYENIRYFLYATVTGCINDDLNWLEYNIDGVTVTAKGVEYVKAYFDKEGLEYKITECKKLDDKKYLYGGVERKFRNR
jgi:hypothetical protein